MGFIALGRKIGATSGAVRYSFERFPGDPDGGSLTIPLDDPEDGWTVDGIDSDRPKSAVVVVVKALRAFRTSGVWPDEVHHAS